MNGIENEPWDQRLTKVLAELEQLTTAAQDRRTQIEEDIAHLKAKFDLEMAQFTADLARTDRLIQVVDNATAPAAPAFTPRSTLPSKAGPERGQRPRYGTVAAMVLAKYPAIPSTFNFDDIMRVLPDLHRPTLSSTLTWMCRAGWAEYAGTRGHYRQRTP